MTFPHHVKLVEVGPRDGLQNEPHFVSTEIKIALVEKLAQAGFMHIEAAAFVSPKWVPQMADGAAVMAGLQAIPSSLVASSLRTDSLATNHFPQAQRLSSKRPQYAALTPNLKGFEAALMAGVDEVVIFTAASETFSHKNINCSIAESLQRFQEVARAAHSTKIKLRGSISCSFGCPYEGEISIESVTKVIHGLAELGCDEIDIADTIGVGTPEQVKRVYAAAGKIFPLAKLSGHFHDTYGQALANIYAALQSGIAIFHSSVAGLGGCPYAKGATGNVASEDVIFMLNGMGIETGIDLQQVVDAGDFISQALGRINNSRTGNALLAQKINR